MKLDVLKRPEDTVNCSRMQSHVQIGVQSKGTARVQRTGLDGYLEARGVPPQRTVHCRWPARRRCASKPSQATCWPPCCCGREDREALSGAVRESGGSVCGVELMEARTGCLAREVAEVGGGGESSPERCRQRGML